MPCVGPLPLKSSLYERQGRGPALVCLSVCHYGGGVRLFTVPVGQQTAGVVVANGFDRHRPFHGWLALPARCRRAGRAVLSRVLAHRKDQRDRDAGDAQVPTGSEARVFRRRQRLEKACLMVRLATEPGAQLTIEARARGRSSHTGAHALRTGQGNVRTRDASSPLRLAHDKS